MSLSQEDINRIAAALAAGGTVAASAPVAPVVASPFTTAGVAASDNRPPEVLAAIARYPGDQGAQRAEIATLRLPLYSCTVDTTATLADGTSVPSALHGFTTPTQKSGEPCRGVKGLTREHGGKCPGTIR